MCLMILPLLTGVKSQSAQFNPSGLEDGLYFIFLCFIGVVICFLFEYLSGVRMGGNHLVNLCQFYTEILTDGGLNGSLYEDLALFLILWFVMVI